MEMVSMQMLMVTAASIHVTSLWRWGAIGPCHAVGTLRSLLATPKTGLAQPDDVKVQKGQIWKVCVALAALASEMYVCMRFLMSFCLSCPPTPFYLQWNIWSTMLNATMNRYLSRPSSKEAGQRESAIFSVVISLFTLLNRVDQPASMAPANLAGRVFLGSFALDPYFFVFVNAALVPFHIALEFCLHTAELSLAEFGTVCFNELFATLTMAWILIQAESFHQRKALAIKTLEEQGRALHNHIKETEGLLEAARRLLAVTCDCCEHLTHDLLITSPSKKIINMLRLPKSLWGKPIDVLQFICSEEHDRFLTFISQAHEVDSGTPSSLHVALKDYAGTTTNAQLFYVCVPASLSAKPQYLLGITVVEPVEPDTIINDLDISSIPEHDQLVTGQISAASERRGARRSRLRSSSSARSSSASSYSHESELSQPVAAASTAAVQQALSSVEKLRLALDLRTGYEGYAIRSATMCFKEENPYARRPCLLDLIKRSHRPLMEDWLQEHANCWNFGRVSSERCLSVKCRLPGFGEVQVGEISFVSISSSLEDEDVGQASSANAGNGDDYDIQMTIELRTVVPT